MVRRNSVGRWDLGRTDRSLPGYPVAWRPQTFLTQRRAGAHHPPEVRQSAASPIGAGRPSWPRRWGDLGAGDGNWQRLVVRPAPKKPGPPGRGGVPDLKSGSLIGNSRGPTGKPAAQPASPQVQVAGVIAGGAFCVPEPSGSSVGAAKTFQPDPADLHQDRRECRENAAVRPVVLAASSESSCQTVAGVGRAA